ncbi:MAG: hypothetical protein HY889_03495 [Deltaproteobacteria bacterium]|nr:hypothetical protein [Deltaproteobacteria bacterium]
MNGCYNRERLELFDALIKRRLDVINGKPWTLEPKSLRFKHGESIAELKVPYHMGADDEACVQNAILALMTLLIRRFEPVSPEGIKDASGLQPLLLNVPPLKEKTYRTDIFISDSLEKKIATEILATTVHMDSAMLCAWLVSDGYGRKFIKWVGDIFEKTLKDEARFGSEEKTSYLALLSAVNTIRKKKEEIKTFRIRGLSYEKVDLLVGMTLFIAFRGAVKDLFERLQAANASYYNRSTELLILASIVPKSFISIPSSILSVAMNPYGINSESFELLAPVADEPDENTSEADDLVKNTAKKVKGEPAVLEALKQQYDIVRFREETLKYLAEFDLPGVEAHEMLYELYNEERLIRNLLSDSKTSSNLVEALEDVKTRFPRDIQRADALTSFIKFLGSFKKSMLGGFLKSSKKEVETLLPMIEGYYAAVLDDHIEKFEAAMRGALIDRRGEFKQSTLVEEYNRGRLYRFSTDDRPLIKTLFLEAEGQLFIDMKDFTRKTLKVKEIAMAEFMKEHFYKPILLAASRYGVGTGVVEDEKGIRLTNLPGDAAIFSGGVAHLVALAKDIQLIIRRYREQLLKRLPPAQDSEILEEVHKRFEARKDDLKRKRAELHLALDRNAPGVETRLVALGEEEHRLENTYREELQNAIKGELEAGLYISYGSKAETMLIEPRGEFSEPVKVAIGEKINEAARGTFRHSMVRAKFEVLLESEKQKRKHKGLRYPFDIYIDRIYSIKMPPELESTFEKLISSRKPSSAQAMAKIMSNEFLSDLRMMISGEPFSSLRLITATTDIYNRGEAISSAALDAYMMDTKGTKTFFRKTVEVSELDQSIRDAFLFPTPEIVFWFGVETVKGRDMIEVFCKSGEIIFKGFETTTPIEVYEIINPEGDFFKYLVKYHFRSWLAESKNRENEII